MTEQFPCWQCGSDEPEENLELMLPIEVGNHPCCPQQIFLCRDCATELAIVIDDWKGS